MQRFRNILLLVEEESLHAAALARGVWLARANGARLTLLDCIESPGELGRLLALLPGGPQSGSGDGVRAARLERLERLAALARDEGVETHIAVEDGPAFLTTIRRVLRDGHDLVLKGQNIGASGIAGRFLGPDLHLMRKCPCPVWIVRDETAAGARRILACVDPDAAADDTTRHVLDRTVMQLALSLAERDGASVDMLGVWRVQEEGILRSNRFDIVPGEVDALIERERLASLARLQVLAAEFADRAVRPNVLHLKGIAGDVIPAHAEHAGIDTIVMGTVGRTGIAGLFIGNTAETVLGRVGCAVIAVKPPGFVSPVTGQA